MGRRYHIAWVSKEYNSVERCTVNISDAGLSATSIITGDQDGMAYAVEYNIRTNASWATLFIEVKARFAGNTEVYSYESDGEGNWTRDGVVVAELAGCIDVDISLTPFTNSLPVNRLSYQDGAAHTIQVLYADILAREVRAARQSYKKLSPVSFKFENVPNDFEAVIIVDERGFVVEYPDLFSRTECRTEYP